MGKNMRYDHSQGVYSSRNYFSRSHLKFVRQIDSRVEKELIINCFIGTDLKDAILVYFYNRLEMNRIN
jgi:hypothetical protein